MKEEEVNKIGNEFYKKLSKLFEEADPKHYALYTFILVDILAKVIASVDENGDVKKVVLENLIEKIECYKSKYSG